jgi:succinate dehydrogenase hydrophobic anchor subunit
MSEFLTRSERQENERRNKIDQEKISEFYKELFRGWVQGFLFCWMMLLFYALLMHKPGIGIGVPTLLSVLFPLSICLAIRGAVFPVAISKAEAQLKRESAVLLSISAILLVVCIWMFVWIGLQPSAPYPIF